MGKEIRGIIPAVVTPFTRDDRVDEAAFRKVLNTMIDQGVHGLFPVGTGGEFFALTREEKERLIPERTGGVALSVATVSRLAREVPNFAGIKEAMLQLGMLDCGRCRRPTLPLTPAQTDEVRRILKETGLL